MKKIGIIGGAGPEAGALLFNNIINEYQENGAWEDHDFPQIILFSVPFSPMIESNENQEKIVKELQSAINYIKSHSEVIAIACNTLHSFISAIEFSPLSFIDLIETVATDIKQKNISKVLFLGTSTSARAGIYDNRGIEIIYPESTEQVAVNDVIVRILKNRCTEKDIAILQKIIDENYKKISFQGVLLGCTELSVVHQKIKIRVPQNVHIFDSINILAKKLASIK